MPPSKPNNKKLKVTSAIVVTLAVVMLVVANTVTKAQQTTRSTSAIAPTSASASTTPSSTTTTTPSASTTSPAPSSGYKDGTYSATSDYYVPHGNEEIQVSLTIKNGIVTDSNITNSEYSGESAQFQESFASEYKGQVIGKSVSGLNLSYVAGASDTTQGFNDALTKIQSEARA